MPYYHHVTVEFLPHTLGATVMAYTGGIEGSLFKSSRRTYMCIDIRLDTDRFRSYISKKMIKDEECDASNANSESEKVRSKMENAQPECIDDAWLPSTRA